MNNINKLFSEYKRYYGPKIKNDLVLKIEGGILRVISTYNKNKKSFCLRTLAEGRDTYKKRIINTRKIKVPVTGRKINKIKLKEWEDIIKAESDADAKSKYSLPSLPSLPVLTGKKKTAQPVYTPKLETDVSNNTDYTNDITNKKYKYKKRRKLLDDPVHFVGTK